MTTSEQWSVISRTHSGPSAGAFGLSTPIQGLNQSFLQEAEDSVAKPHSERCVNGCVMIKAFYSIFTILYYSYFAEALH